MNNNVLKRKSFFGAVLFVLTHIIIVFIAFVLQVSIFPMIPFLKATPNFLLIIVFSYGLLYGENIGLITGLFCGLVFDLYFDTAFGIYTLIYSVIGYINGRLHYSFIEDSISLPMMLCLINSFAYNLYIYVMYFLIRGKFNFFYCFFNVMFPNILFTTIVTTILYKLFYQYNVKNK